MGCFATELLRPNFVSKTITDFLFHRSTTPCSTLDDIVTKLELELTKIQPFKRELPLCMLLLNDAIIALRVESAKCRGQKSEPVLQELIPLKKVCDEKDEENRKEKECIDKKNWMSCVQLWNNNSYNNSSKVEMKKKNEGKEFDMPFSNYFATKEEKEDCVVNGVSMKNSSEGSGSSGSRSSFSRVVPSSPMMKTYQKQRRSWSPELHRRFVEALEELGGSQVATPKQIRSLMRVDGLTNDEVKSHLQKYRLHARRVPPATTNEGLWMYNGSCYQGLAARSGEKETSQTKGGKLKDVKSELL